MRDNDIYKKDIKFTIVIIIRYVSKTDIKSCIYSYYIFSLQFIIFIKNNFINII